MIIDPGVSEKNCGPWVHRRHLEDLGRGTWSVRGLPGFVYMQFKRKLKCPLRNGIGATCSDTSIIRSLPMSEITYRSEVGPDWTASLTLLSFSPNILHQNPLLTHHAMETPLFGYC